MPKTQKRQEYLFDKLSDVLWNKADSDNGMISLKDLHIINKEELFEYFLKCDLTHNKQYSQWIIRQYIAGHFLLEDLPKISDDLVLFHKVKSKVKQDNREIQQYTNPSQLWEILKPFRENTESQLSSHEKKNLDKEKAYEESEILLDRDDGMKIIVPLTEFSAKWWGGNSYGVSTRWCTSTKNNNMFEYYAKKSPLYIIIIPNNIGGYDKLQFWSHEGNIQFMDSEDIPITKDYISQYPDIINILIIIDNTGLFIKYLPDEFITQEICELAIRQSGIALRYVPDEFVTPELCELVVRQDGRALEYIPYKFKTQELYKIAVRQNGLSLKDVPEKFMTQELYEITVRQDGLALGDVPEKLRTKEICEFAVRQSGGALCFVPDELRTQELCEIAVRKDGDALCFVPDELRTQEICKIAISQNGNSLEWVTKELKTQELCEIAVSQNGHALRYVPQELKTKEICEIAVRENGWALKYVPDELKTKEICELAVRKNGWALEWVPEEFKTKEICEIAVRQDSYALRYVPQELRTREICELAVSQNSDAFGWVPDMIRPFIILLEKPLFVAKYDDISFKGISSYLN